MTVTQALSILRCVGSVAASGDKLKIKFPDNARSDLQPAIDVLRRGKTEALALLSHESVGRQETVVNTPGLPRLKGHAVELWRDGERFFLVADEDDAELAVSRLSGTHSEVWTTAELEMVALIVDKSAREEIQSFKRQLDGRVINVRVEPKHGGAV